MVTQFSSPYSERCYHENENENWMDDLRQGYKMKDQLKRKK